MSQHRTEFGALPWQVDLSGDHPNVRIVDADGRGIGFAIQRDDWRPGDGVSRKDAEARAAVMAAGPDLLAALESLLSAVQRSVCDGSGPEQDAAHAAIHKAVANYRSDK